MVGLCQMQDFGPTIGVSLGWNGFSFEQARVDYFRQLVRLRFDQCLEGVADPLLVFVKQEPIKREKALQERWRLIQASSVVDTMVDRILYGPLTSLFIDRSSPVLAGWQPAKGGHRLIRAAFPRGCLMADRTAFDWTVNEYDVRMLSNLLEELHPCAPEWWLTRHRARMTLIYRMAVLQFQDGTQEDQKDWGFQKSGTFLTFISNSLIQLLNHALACRRLGESPSPWPFVLGDDTVQTNRSDAYINELGKCGRIVRAERGLIPEFAGFRFGENGPVPAYLDKHAFRLKALAPEVLSEALQSYCFMYVNTPWFTWMQRELSRMDPDRVPTFHEAKYLMDIG